MATSQLTKTTIPNQNLWVSVCLPDGRKLRSQPIKTNTKIRILTKAKKSYQKKVKNNLNTKPAYSKN